MSLTIKAFKKQRRKKAAKTYYVFTLVYQNSCYLVVEIWLGTNIEVILDQFLSFTPVRAIKTKTILKTKVSCRDTRILHQFTKNHDMLNCKVVT